MDGIYAKLGVAEEDLQTVGGDGDREETGQDDTTFMDIAEIENVRRSAATVADERESEKVLEEESKLREEDPTFDGGYRRAMRRSRAPPRVQQNR